ncbi:MAG TPA: hypothetical protein VEG36_01760, partial [Burkholderiales bacterium]|nr:hypothetical protein [Burkholderiales bacterium]
MAQARAASVEGETHGPRLDGAQFVWLVGSLCRISRLPFDPRLLVQRFPAPHSVMQLLEALKSLGFRAGESPCDPGKLRFPCVAFLKGEPSRPAILVKRDAERLLYFEAGSQTSGTVPVSDLTATFASTAILVRHRAAAAPTGDGADAPGEFGFRWFWAELLKHRRVCRDVLAASLFIQLLGFATPLGTQVVIDKVVVHQTQSTL